MLDLELDRSVWLRKRSTFRAIEDDGAEVEQLGLQTRQKFHLSSVW